MIATEVEEQIKPLVKTPLLKTKIPANNFIIPQGVPINFWQPDYIESPYKKAVDLFADNADFISHSIDAMDGSFLR